MCRNIRQLYNFEPPATDEEIYNASLQFVRKLSGFTKPSKVNEPIFEQAITQISENVKFLLNNLSTNAPTKNREEEARKRKERFQKHSTK